jgi:hypothetical protein
MVVGCFTLVALALLILVPQPGKSIAYAADNAPLWPISMDYPEDGSVFPRASRLPPFSGAMESANPGR